MALAASRIVDATSNPDIFIRILFPPVSPVGTFPNPMQWIPLKVA
jgi:hypothetical protein